MKKHYLLLNLVIFAIFPFCLGISCFAVKEQLIAYVGPITQNMVEPIVLLRVGAFLLFVGIINFFSLAIRQEIFVKIFLIVGVGCVTFGNFGPWTKEFPFVISGTLSIILGGFNSLSLLMKEQKQVVEKPESKTAEK